MTRHDLLETASVAVVFGTRPEIIKLAHIVEELGPAARVIHTGQHYDRALSQIFIEGFGLAEPKERLEIGGSTRGQQIGSALESLDALLSESRPRVVVVQGDTNTALAGGLAANALDIPLCHVEAGLRSFDRRMPEEHNRVLVDHVSDMLMAPTKTSKQNLIDEGLDEDLISVTGNTVVEAVERLMPGVGRRTQILRDHGLESSGYVLSTFHRPENVDDPEVFAAILEDLASLPMPVVLPLHPRSRIRAKDHGLGRLLQEIRVVDPIGYEEFLGLGAESALLITDSGGVQEEVSVYKRPVIVVRRSTERPEVIGTFARLVQPGDQLRSVASDWLEDLGVVHEGLSAIESPYGDGSASATIVAELEHRFAE